MLKALCNVISPLFRVLKYVFSSMESKKIMVKFVTEYYLSAQRLFTALCCCCWQGWSWIAFVQSSRTHLQGKSKNVPWITLLAKN